MSMKKGNHKIHPIPVLQDNIIWVWIFQKEAVVVDPAEAIQVKTFLKANKLNLKAVLQTHHHADHIGGTPELLKEWPDAEVVASKKDINRIPFQTISVEEGDELFLMGKKIDIIELIGHTKTHISYYISSSNHNKDMPAVFCGDTLFAAGCGRLFEGTPEDMYKSLKRLNSLPEETKVYCAHEYTEANLAWANSILPEDIVIKERLEKVIKLRKNNLTTLPTSIKEERLSNLFIRANSIKELAELRKHKDEWA